MTVSVQNFLGRTLEIPEDRKYLAGEGLWIKKQGDGRLAVGLTEPALLMTGPVREVEELAEEGGQVTDGQSVALALTAKIKYIEAPLSGGISYSPDLDQAPGALADAPYDTALFYLSGADFDAERLCNAQGYAHSLADSDGSRNPTGASGPASSTCKAVYMGIGAQSLKQD